MTTVPQGGEIRVSFPAGADLSAKAGYFVELATGVVTVCNAATDKPLGVLAEGVVSGLQAEVIVFGPAKVVVDGAVDQGDLIGTSADGQADKKIPGTDTTEYAVGIALETATTAGEKISALINCVNPHRAA